MSETNGTQKMLLAVIAAGSVGGLGGHTVGAINGDTSYGSLTACERLMEFAANQTRLKCETEKIKLLLECKHVTD